MNVSIKKYKLVIAGVIAALCLAFVAGFVESKIGLDSEFADALCFYYIPLPIIGINLVAGIIYILFNRVKKEIKETKEKRHLRNR